MERLPIELLEPGKTLDSGLHDATGRLLLAGGGVLDHEMVAALRRSTEKYVYLGDWNPEEFERFKAAKPVSEYRNLAQQMARKLEGEIERAVLNDKLDVIPEGKPFAGNMDRSLQRKRSQDRLDEWEATHHESVACMKDIAQGLIEDVAVAEAASSVVSNVMKAFQADSSLLNNLTNLKSKSDYLYTHSINTVILSINIASALELGQQQVKEVGIGALLHNLGMAMVPNEILDAPRKLTPGEFVDIQKHISYGLYAFEKYRGLPYSARFILYQNKERADGSGYPKRRKKKVIHKFAQIVGVADVFDAMTSNRPWRKAYHPYRAMDYLIHHARKEFDGEIIRGLLRYLSLFPIGSIVKLSSGEVARVVHGNHDAFDKPSVSVLIDAKGQPNSTPHTVDLSQSQEIHVESVVEEELDISLTAGF